MKLEAAGIDLRDRRSRAPTLIRKHVGRMAGGPGGALREDGSRGDHRRRATSGKVFESLRPLGTEAVRVIFGRAMERELRKLYESGRMAKLPRKARRAKRS